MAAALSGLDCKNRVGRIIFVRFFFFFISKAGNKKSNLIHVVPIVRLVISTMHGNSSGAPT